MAERLTVAYARAASSIADGSLTASSAGTGAVIGHPIETSAALVLSGLGGKSDGFRSRQLAAEQIDPADLVLTMTRKQRAAVLQLAPRMMSRTFTLREAATLLTAVSPSRVGDDPDLTIRGRRLVAELAAVRPARVMGRSGEGDDITDPIGRELATFQKVGDAISEALLPLLRALAGQGAWARQGTLPIGLPGLASVRPVR